MLTIKIRTDNAAFENNAYEECARILEDIAYKLREGNKDMVCLDINGNLVGHAKLTKR